MVKEVVVHVHNGILLSHKKEHILVSSNEVDEPRASYTKRTKSERERYIQNKIYCMLTHICEMATHSSVLAWRIPGTGEPGGLPSMGSHRVGHD